MNPYQWTYLNGSIRYCPSCKAYGEQKHRQGCPDRWQYRRNASDDECIARMGEAIAMLSDPFTPTPKPSPKVARCTKPSPSCIERGFARKVSGGYQCLREPITAERIPADAQQVVSITEDGTSVCCLRYRPDAWDGGRGRQKAPKRLVVQNVPEVESSAQSVRDWLTARLAAISRQGYAASGFLRDGRGGEQAADFLTARVALGKAARDALSGEPYDDALDAFMFERMMQMRPWR